MVDALVDTEAGADVAQDLWVPLGELVGRDGFNNGLSVKSGDGTDGIHCLTLSSMRGGVIIGRERKPVPLTASQAAPYRVRAGDVFVVRGNGSKHLVGRAARVVEAIPSTIYPDLFIRVRLPLDRIDPAYFVTVMNGRQARRRIEELAKTTSGIWKINQGHLAAIQIPLPSVSEQQVIVRHTSALRHEVARLKECQAATAAELSALLPSVLDRAFRGQL